MYNLTQSDIEDFETMNIQFKETGNEKEAMDNLYTCPNCFSKYLICDCEKGIKKIIEDKEDLDLLLKSYRIALNAKPSQNRSYALKILSEMIRKYKV
ncbi:MAG: hypothetical protein U0354_20940 [Candidatus Sericytochromatia bacterium]